ncbi:MAG: hypothetical protein NT023_01005 [Armatimonadetes bacterium]|nr:hypothetical protein [Armatimonadota bacterium]
MKKKNAESENTKAKTTKETVYKTTPPSPSTYKNPRMEEAIQAFLHLYQKRFQERSPQSLSSPFSENKEGKLIRELLEQYPLETLCDLLERFFSLDDKWVREQGYSLIAFRHRLPRLLMHSPHTASPLTTKSVRWSKVNTLLSYANTSETKSKGGV